MKQNVRPLRICILLLMMGILVALPLPARAGGLMLYEIGSPEVGLAAAGWAARAQDAATAFTNPAGMTKLERSQLLVGTQLIFPSIHFNVAPGPDGFLGPPGETGNAGVITPGLTGFYVHKLSEKWRLGVSLISYFGLGIDYGDAWAGRYYLQKALLFTAALVPAAAYKVNDWLSVGAGPIIMLAKIEESAAINNLTSPDGRLTGKDTTFGFGGMAGVMLEPRNGTRLGVTYYSPVELSFTDVISTSGLGQNLRAALGAAGLLGAKTDLTMTVPQQVMLSAYHQLTDKLALLANFGWQNWPQFGQIDVNIAAQNTKSFTADAKLKDTFHGALGAQFRLAPAWLISAGFAFDSSFVSDANRTVATAADRQFRYAAGLQYNWNENVTLGLAYELLDGGPASLDIRRGPLAGRLVGDFSSNYLHFVNANLVWRF